MGTKINILPGFSLTGRYLLISDVKFTIFDFAQPSILKSEILNLNFIVTFLPCRSLQFFFPTT
jgi:hypothetical protein